MRREVDKPVQCVHILRDTQRGNAGKERQATEMAQPGQRQRVGRRSGESCGRAVGLADYCYCYYYYYYYYCYHYKDGKSCSAVLRIMSERKRGRPDG